MPVQSPREFVEQFKRKQACDYVEKNNGCILLFANGASIQVCDPQSGEDMATGEQEPPFDDEVSLVRQLEYWRLKHEDEYSKWSQFKQSIIDNAANVISGHDVRSPTMGELTQLEAGTLRCNEYAAKITEISEALFNLPRLQQLEQREAQAAADRTARKESAAAIQGKANALTVPTPASLRNPKLELFLKTV